MPAREQPSTTPAAAAQAGTREQPPSLPHEPPQPEGGEGIAYEIGPGVERGVRGRPYERHPDDPLYRSLRIFVLDPAASRLEGSTAQVNIPYEPLEQGFPGHIFEIDSRDGATGQQYRTLDLNDRKILLNDGCPPSPADPLFHQQMVYAVASLVYAAFKTALGRHPAWGFKRQEGEGRLRLRPYAFEGENAHYDCDKGEIAFGYFRAHPGSIGRNIPGGLVFTSLSHDIVVHETTHALLDGLRSHFSFPSGPDVMGLHEAFADLMSIFQRFSYRTVVERAMGEARGEMRQAKILSDVARQFGQTVTGKEAMRSAIDTTGSKRYDPTLEPHDLGSVLVSAVFDAFATVFKRRTERYVRLATGGSGVLPPGEIHPELRSLLAEEASKLAAHFQTICIRAIDYLPPVDPEFGEFLRAVITADRDLVPDDSWGYREAWIDAFGNRGIFPRNVRFLSEDALLWEPPRPPVNNITELSFASLRFEGDPACPASSSELRRQAGALGRVVTDPAFMEQFGLVRQGDPRLKGDRVELPRVQSIRSSRRIGPQGQVVFDLVAEITQPRKVGGRGEERGFDFPGGATVIIGPQGEIRYTVTKSVLNEERLLRQRDFMGGRGKGLWNLDEGRVVPVPQPFRLLHKGRKNI